MISVDEAKKNILRTVFADPRAAEFLQGVYAVGIAIPTLPIDSKTVLAIIVLFVGSIRLTALLTGALRLRLFIAYVATFVWCYYALFMTIEVEPAKIRIEHTGWYLFMLGNAWIAWRLQTMYHFRKGYA